MSDLKTQKAKRMRLPPRWFIRLFWLAHRRLYRWTGGRLGLWRPKPNGWGAMRVTTIGRRTGRVHPVIVGYFEDGPNLVTMAMNGWGDAEPVWWLNLQAHPDVTVDTVDGPHKVAARVAHGAERERLWNRWRQLDFGFFRPGAIKDVLAGKISGIEITQGFLLAVSVYIAIASAMVFLSLVLRPRVNRWTNIVLPVLYIVSIAATCIGEAWAYYFFLSAAETVLLALIVWYAWKWPKQA